MSLHCTSCGAPILEIDAQGSFRCGHCGTAQGPNARTLTEEGLVLSGHDEHSSCPVCDIPLQGGKVKENTPVLGCPQCHGYLIEPEAFGHLVNQERANYRGADVIPTPLDDAARARRLACVECGRKMEAYFYAGPGNAFIDGCTPCGKIWLDAGELQQIIAAPGRRGQVPARPPVGPARLAPTDMNSTFPDLTSSRGDHTGQGGFGVEYGGGLGSFFATLFGD